MLIFEILENNSTLCLFAPPKSVAALDKIMETGSPRTASSAIESFSICNSARDDQNTRLARPISHSLWQPRTLQAADSADDEMHLATIADEQADVAGYFRNRNLAGMLLRRTNH